MDKPLISPEHLAALESAFAGGVLSLLFQRKLTWWTALLIFTSGEIMAFYCTGPFAAWSGWNPGVVGLTLGLSAMYICGGIFIALGKFLESPWRFLRSIPAVQALIGKEPDNDGGHV